MRPSIYAFLLIALLVLLEVGLAVWRNSGRIPSTDPVFSYPPAVENFDKPGDFQKIIDAVHADHGAELKIDDVKGTRLTVFYFEWDEIKIGPVTDIAGHQPEICNEAMGYSLLGVESPRTYQTPGHDSLQFDVTRFADSSGRVVHVFKGAWFQGIGSWNIRLTQNRIARAKASFLRAEGAARVIEAGVFGADNTDDAWRAFEANVLSKLQWSEDSQSAHAEDPKQMDQP